MDSVSVIYKIKNILEIQPLLGLSNCQRHAKHEWQPSVFYDPYTTRIIMLDKLLSLNERNLMNVRNISFSVKKEILAK